MTSLCFAEHSREGASDVALGGRSGGIDASLLRRRAAVVRLTLGQGGSRADDGEFARNGRHVRLGVSTDLDGLVRLGIDEVE